ncbi:MAG: hypothetical protein PF447_01930 [Spirochaetaceae bacterium]|jgi:DNA polymerase III delta prime subunit|nr:hypothetical protein [Spirochaetaceae bacterium]
MFENLLHQQRIRERLSSDVKSRQLPQAILLAGPAYSGKNTAATELARVLNCKEQDAPWDCSCHSCQSQRLLIHPDTLFLGRSHFGIDIEAAIDLLQRLDAPAARYMLVRNVRRLLRRFDSQIWEGEEKRISKGAKSLEELNQWIHDMGPQHPLPPNWQKELSGHLKALYELEKMIPMTIPIHQIRRINNWSHMASQGQDVKKVVIMDGVEQMQESARNALLKLLEEPPKSVYMILLSTQKRKVMPTILSRLRCYDFSARDKEAAHAVQKRIFRIDDPMDNLSEFFQQFQRGNGHIGSQASKFLLTIYQGEQNFPQQLFQDYQKEELPFFFHQMLETLRSWLRQSSQGEMPSLPLSVMQRWNRSIRESYRSMEMLNLSALLMLEDLFYRLRDQL